jgi:hypothetical protein
MTSGVRPGDPSAAPAVGHYADAFASAFGRANDREFRRWLGAQLSRHTDPRALRFWQLVATIRGAGEEPQGSRRLREAHAWLMAGLIADVAGDPA